MKNFNVTVPAGSKLVLSLSTNFGAPVSVEDFAIIVKTFHKGNFLLNVDYESTVANSNLKYVTPLVNDHFNFQRILVNKFIYI